MIPKLWVIALIVIVGCSLSAYGKYGGGSGEPNDPYQIWDANHIQAISSDANDWDKCFILMADVNLGGITFDKAVIAPDLDDTTEDFIGTPFEGRFDGNGHRILNLTVDTGGLDRLDLGFFGNIAAGAVIANLGLENVKITGNGNRVHYPEVEFTGGFGGLCGESSGSIHSCWVIGSVTGGNYSEDVGGLCGYNRETGKIERCYVMGSVVCGPNSGGIGGLCGSNDGSISKSYTTGSVSGNDYLGGLVGYNSEGSIINCYATSIITGNSILGGLVGENSEGSITNCYAIGTVTGNSALGGLIGDNGGTPVSNCFWDMETSGQGISDGGFGRTTVEMKQATTYVGWGNGIWTIEEGLSYPHLLWEGAGGTIIDNIPNRSYSGNGTQEDPFIIASVDDMICLTARQQDWDKCFKLVNDIDMAQVTNYLPPGNFRGKFNGNSLNIMNLTIIEPTFLLGLFGYLSEGSVINNLGVVNIQIDGYRYLGGLCGMNRGSITNCYSSGSVTGGDDSEYLGGLVGCNEGTINNCYAFVSVTGGDGSYGLVGGLVGDNYEGTITNCYATGTVTGRDNSKNIGGLVGFNNDGSISNCYSTGYVSAGAYSYSLGGLCGERDGGIISNCFWDVNTSGQETSAGGEGKTTAEMQEPNTFTDAGWDFITPIWMVCGQDYPKLIWNYPNINGDVRVNFFDFAELASYWMNFDCGMCGRTDLTGDRNIDNYDLRVFVDSWLKEDVISSHVFNIYLTYSWDYGSPDYSWDTAYVLYV